MRDFTWLVDRRYQIQVFLNDLYRQIAHQQTIREHKVQRRAYGLLIGASFSLWRAVFLVKEEDRDWEQIFNAGTEFLEKLIETNAIAFSDEFNPKNRTWTAGYYLNNARFRAEKAAEELLGIQQPTNVHFDRESFEVLITKLKVGISEENRALTEVWDEAFDAVKVIFDHARLV